MSKYNNLPASTKKRDIPAIIPEVVDDFDINAINLPNESKIKLTPKQVGNVIQVGHIVVAGMVDIIKIREQGQQNIKQIEADIQKIIKEADAEVKKIEASSKDWHGKFDKRRDYVLLLIDKIEQNPNWSDETKREMIRLAQKGIEDVK